jgi:hypothetical protein
VETGDGFPDHARLVGSSHFMSFSTRGTIGLSTFPVKGGSSIDLQWDPGEGRGFN